MKLLPPPPDWDDDSGEAGEDGMIPKDIEQIGDPEELKPLRDLLNKILTNGTI